MPNKSTKDYKVSLNQDDSQRVDQMANKLRTTKTDVFRKALKLMSVYTDAMDEGDVSITVKDKDGNESRIHIV